MVEHFGWAFSSKTREMWFESLGLILCSFFKKWVILGLLFVYFRSFSNKQHKIYNKLMWKMSIQFLVPAFKLTIFWLWVSSFNHWTRAPAQCFLFFVRFFVRIEKTKIKIAKKITKKLFWEWTLMETFAIGRQANTFNHVV